VGTSLSVENNPLQAKASRTPPSTQDAQQFCNHMTSRQSIKGPEEGNRAQSVSDKSTAERVQDSKGERGGMDGISVAQTDARNTSSETDMATSST
jgi:hypothetical protein